jgi:anti-sigma factor RsiW
MTDLEARTRLGAALRDDLARATAEEQPIAYETLEAYVDGMLDDVDREIVETRLADDPALRAEVEELSALRRELRVDVEGQPSVPAPEVLAFPSSADRTASRMRTRVSLIAPLLAAAAAIVVVVWAGAEWGRRDRQQARRDGAAGGDPLNPGLSPPDFARAPSGKQAERAGGSSGAAGGPPAAPRAGAPDVAATAKLTLRDGDGVVTLAADGTIGGLDRADSALRADIARMLTTGRMPDPPRDLAAARGQLLGPAAPTRRSEPGVASREPAFAVRGPVATALRDSRPVFTWTAAPGASGYRVHVVDASLDVVADSDRLTTTTWRPERPLPRGRALQWQVEAETASGPVLTPVPPAPEALFRIVTTEEAARVDGEVAAVGGSSLAAAWILARAGLRDEAAAALAALAAANVNASSAEQSLLERLRASLRSR